MRKSNLFFIICIVLCFCLSITFLIFPRNTFYKVKKNFKNVTTVEIYEDKKIKQPIKTGIIKLEDIHISLADADKKNYFDGTLEVAFFENKKELYSDEYKYEELKDEIIRIDVSDINIDYEKNLFIEIECNDCSEKAPLVLNISNEIDKDDVMIFNGKTVNKAVSMDVYGYHYNYSYAILFFGVYCILFFVLCFINIKSDKKRKLYLYYVLEFFISIIFYVLVIKNLNNYIYLSKMFILSFIFLIITSSILIYLFVLLLKYSKKQKEHLYLTIAIPLALGYAIFMLPNYVPDEPVHFTRAYNLIDDSIFSTDSEADVPLDFITYNIDNINNYGDLEYAIMMSTNYNDEVSFTSVPNYGFILYIFADIGIIIGKLFSLSILFTYYLARIFNSIGMLLFGYLIIKYLPFGKNIALVYLLNPMYLHQGASVSADSMVNSICLLFMSIVLLLRVKKKIKKEDIWLLIILIVLLGFAKYIYIPLILLLFLLKKNKDSFNKKSKRYIILSAISAVLLCAFFVISLYLIPSSKSGVHDIAVGVENISMFEQMKYILSNPSYAIKCMFNTLNYKLIDYVITFFGRRLGWLSIGVHYIFIHLYVLLFLVSPFIYSDNEIGFFSSKEKYYCNFLSLIISFLCILSMWLCWTSIGGMLIEGVQGRYFIPIAFLSLLTLSNKEQKIKIKNYEYKLSMMLILIHIGVFASIIYYFI